jgi:hypothetical protein
MFLRDTEKRAKIKFGEIMKDDEFWIYVSDMVMEDDSTQFFKRCYDNLRDIWE